MDSHQETMILWGKTLIAWIAVLISGVTASQIMIWLTIALSASSLYLNILKIRQHKRAESAQED
ncbi:hypothetical protein R77567_01603 [Ralstonia sp. LMG 32965]|uniref:Uncharacterized protein n=1 Tax=Ralstonia flatus TaxID=3058601 RepID=A0AAD2BXE8_9RALS|nr:hypothetical protein [Ralstonia sp. LMG 32965]MBN6211418.1 hypothetical protein [Ralstonia pickettii]CAJ0861952.1 hypothetical protein R77567_01603 [Ralstonia sp. LMG 32965]